MPRRINDTCINCGWCVTQCPVDCISFNEDRMITEIDERICIDCGACQQVCPVSSINEVIKELREAKEDDTHEKNKFNLFNKG
jgi:NAD-dependent dihydropyrimidine dehydrogenase PreA subunit